MTMPTTGLSQVDEAALQLAYEIGRSESPAYRAHLDAIEAESGWRTAAEHACFHLQCKNQHLKCWECPPSSCINNIDVIDDLVYGSRTKEVKLRRRMLALGLSLYEPDPAAAIAKAKSARRAERRAARRNARGGDDDSAHPVP
jgi:hypothetical protein